MLMDLPMQLLLSKFVQDMIQLLNIYLLYKDMTIGEVLASLMDGIRKIQLKLHSLMTQVVSSQVQTKEKALIQ